MGNLWSENNQSSRRRNEEVQRQLTLEAELRRRNALENLQLRIHQQQLFEQRRISSVGYPDDNSFRISRARVIDTEPVSRTQRTPDHRLINCITNHSSINNWEPMDSCDTIKYVELMTDTEEYMEIVQMFKSTNKKCFKVVRIERIQNPYLYGAYLLRKEEITSRVGHPKQRLLFHGTRTCNIDGICENNFDWRLHGRGTGHRFGRGVSFSPISNYATHYCDKHSSVKVMLVVKVLISRACLGSVEMDLPPNGFDTTQKPGGQVIVKYYDNEYYPAYKLYFTQVGSDI